MDTIFAISSGRPPAAIAVMRVSGSAARNVAEALAGGLPTARRASLRALRDADGTLLDRALVLWFPGPDTATGEDCLEFHLHGGRALIAAVETAVAALPGLRGAEAGEFTRRALLNGRIDLAQAEGLADLLEAQTETQRRAAIASADGAFSRDLHDWLDRVSQVRAILEARIDYDEEGDVAAGAADPTPLLQELCDDMAQTLSRPTVEHLQRGFEIVIAGPPNAGKSSLFNAMIGEDAAIVTPIAGTTRDRITKAVIRSGQVFTISDTAGLAEETDDRVEAEGIVRSHRAMAIADLVLWLGDDAPHGVENVLWLHARADLVGRGKPKLGQNLAVSARRPESIGLLWDVVVEQTSSCLEPTEQYLLHDEQRKSMSGAVEACRASIVETDDVLAAEWLRVAARRLARLLGVDETEAMLDALFSRFCVGK